MSNLKYKSNNPSTTSTTANLPIWCSLSTPSQIARKYASIAPIWCHISRPRQLKKKFASTFHQAQNLLTRQHSKDTNTNNNTNNNNEDNDDNDLNETDDMNNYKTPVSATNIPSSSKAKLTNTNNDYDKTSPTDLYDAQRTSLKKRDGSLDLKRDSIVPSSSSSYLFNSNGSSNTNKIISDSIASRWAASNGTTNNGINKSAKSQYSLNSKDSYDSALAAGMVAAIYDDNVGTSSAIHSHAADTITSSTRRPNKYVSSKYGEKLNGSKTEKILSKPSKSSPNLLTKDYDHLYTDKYDQNSQKWHSGNSYSSHHQYHSNVNPYLGNNYSNYNSYNYQPMASTTTNSSSTNADNSNYSHYNNYNPTSTTREDKWNELDSMLGAQSALLSRLESDFVANRTKLKTNPSLNSISTVANNSSTNPIKSATQAPSSSGLLARYQQLANQSSNNLRSNLYAKHRTPNSNSTNQTTTTTTTTNTNTTCTNNNNNHINNKPYFNYIGKLEETDTQENNSKYSSKKQEPIIDLIRCLELNDEKQRKAEELENANLTSKNLTIETTINLKNYNNQLTSDENIDDFVDEFINDYFNNTLKSDINNNNTTTTNCNNISANNPSITSINNNNNNNQNSTNSNKSNTNSSNNSSKTNSNNNICNLINNNNNVINTVNSLNEINNNTTTSSSNSNYNLSNTINSDNYNQNWFVSITFCFKLLCVCLLNKIK